MPATWTIKINPGTAEEPAKFDPPTLSNVAPGDQIIWANHDETEAHWPGLQNPDGTIDEGYFMQTQIAPKPEFSSSTSTTFSPGSNGTLVYVCSLHAGETGTIQVDAQP
jgi:plastocyanin